MPYTDKKVRAEYVRRLYHERREEAIRQLGGNCNHCKSTKRLEIDHIDPKKKEIPLNRLWSVSKERYKEELRKCQLLCYSCHRNKSIKDLGKQRRQHGNEAMYSHGGCRCNLCKKARAVAVFNWKEKKLRSVKNEHA